MTLRERAFIAFLRLRRMDTSLALWRTHPRKHRLALIDAPRQVPNFVDGYLAGWAARGRKNR